MTFVSSLSFVSSTPRPGLACLVSARARAPPGRPTHRVLARATEPARSTWGEAASGRGSCIAPIQLDAILVWMRESVQLQGSGNACRPFEAAGWSFLEEALARMTWFLDS